MSKAEEISKLTTRQLKTIESKEKYLNLLLSRIDENRKSLRTLMNIMVLTVFAFPLIVETKISEISVGPFKLQDNLFAISILPSIFSFCYYKYFAMWIELIEQKFISANLTAQIFSINESSYLNERLKPFTFADYIIYNSTQIKSKKFGCFLALFWMPTVIALVFFPFLFEYYTVKVLYDAGLNTLLDWIFFLTPIITGLFTMLFFFQSHNVLDEMTKTENKTFS